MNESKNGQQNNSEEIAAEICAGDISDNLIDTDGDDAGNVDKADDIGMGGADNEAVNAADCDNTDAGDDSAVTDKKSKLKALLKKITQFLFNPHMLICFGIAWLITNGWSYIFVAVGTWLKIRWMQVVGGAYMSFLWFPFTPEKLVTLIIAVFLLKLMFPKDEKTLKVLHDELETLKNKFRTKKAERAEKKGKKK